MNVSEVLNACRTRTDALIFADWLTEVGEEERAAAVRRVAFAFARPRPLEEVLKVADNDTRALMLSELIHVVGDRELQLCWGVRNQRATVDVRIEEAKRSGEGGLRWSGGVTGVKRERAQGLIPPQASGLHALAVVVKHVACRPDVLYYTSRSYETTVSLWP